MQFQAESSHSTDVQISDWIASILIFLHALNVMVSYTGWGGLKSMVVRMRRWSERPMSMTSTSSWPPSILDIITSNVPPSSCVAPDTHCLQSISANILLNSRLTIRRIFVVYVDIACDVEWSRKAAYVTLFAFVTISGAPLSEQLPLVGWHGLVVGSAKEIVVTDSLVPLPESGIPLSF